MNTPEPTGNSFDALLRDLNKGRTLADLNDAFPDLVRLVRTHGKAGTLSFTVKVAPASGGDASRVTITSAVAVKAPTAAPRASIYYTTEDGGVQKNDPDQAVMVFTPLPAAAPEPAPVAPPVANTATA